MNRFYRLKSSVEEEKKKGVFNHVKRFKSCKISDDIFCDSNTSLGRHIKNKPHPNKWWKPIIEKT